MAFKNLSKYIFIPQRIIFSIMGFLIFTISYISRNSIPFIVIKMVAKLNKPLHGTVSVSSTECMSDFINLPINSSVDAQQINYVMMNSDIITYDWSEETQGLILSAFYFGYTLAQIPAGLLASKFGGKYLLLLTAALNSIINFTTPFLTNVGGATFLIAARILSGIIDGSIVPALTVLISAWIPVKERTRISAFIFSGSMVGATTGAAFTSYLLSTFDVWSIPFYFCGAVNILWFLFFSILCYRDPISHPFISDEEKLYLEKTLEPLEKYGDKASTPWKAMFRSSAVWAILLGQFGCSILLYLLGISLPKYLNDVLKLTILQNGIYSAVPHIIMFFVCQFSAFICDRLINTKLMSITKARKMFTIISIVGVSCFTLAISYAECDKQIAIIFSMIAMSFGGFFFSGTIVNHLDVSPNYSGVLGGIGNFFSSAPGFIVPYAVSLLTPNTLMSEWRAVFWINFFLAIPFLVIIAVCTSGEIQPWNDPNKLKQKNVPII